MRNKINKIQIIGPGFLCVILMMSGCISLGSFKKFNERHEKLRAENKDLEAEVNRLQDLNRGIETTLMENRKELQKKDEKISDLRSTYDDLIQELKEDIAKGLVEVNSTGKDLTISMGNKVLFRSGQARIQSKGKGILKNVANVLKKVEGYFIRCEGHSDNIPIRGALKKRFPSNWELSAARSAAVLYTLQVEGGVNPENLILTSFAEFRPVADNSTTEGRRLNRRVELSLILKSQYK